MPFTINGVGTTYFGKKNKNEYQGKCEFCGQPSQIIDYDTLHSVCLLYIPIIPLGRKRVLGECNHCGQHRTLKLSEWEDSVESALTESMLRMKEKPHDLAAAIELHQTFHQAGKQDQAAEIARVIKERFPRDFDAHYYLTTWYEITGRPEDAQKSIRKAYELAPHKPEAIQGMAVAYIQEGEPDRAEKLLEELEQDEEHHDPGLWILLAEAYQQQGEHKRAHQLFTKLKEESPELSRHPDFSKAVRKTEKHLKPTNRILKPVPIYQQPWAIVSAVVLLIGSVVVMGSLYLKSNRSVYVLNGLNEPIEVMVGEELIHVPPLSQTEVSVSEGAHTVQLQAPLSEVEKREPYDFTMESSFFKRLIDDTVTILDPTESAAYMKVVEFYSEDEDQDFSERAAKESQVFMFEKLKQFDDINFYFEEFPLEIHVSSSNPTEVHQRTGLRLIQDRGFGAAYLLREIGTNGMSEKQIDTRQTRFLERYLPDEDSPEDQPLDEDLSLVLQTYSTVLTEQEQLDRFRSVMIRWLKAHPDEFFWADSYGEMMNRLDRFTEGTEDIQKWAEEFPEIATFQYMLASVTPSLQKRVEIYSDLYQKQADNNQLLNVYKQALHAAGQYEKAIEVEEVGFALRKQRYSDNPQWNDLEVEFPENSQSLFKLVCLLCLRDLEQIDQIYAELAESEFTDMGLLQFRIEELIETGRSSEVPAVIEAWQANYDKKYDQQTDWVAQFPEFWKLFCSGEFKAAIDIQESGESLKYYDEVRYELILLTQDDYQTKINTMMKELSEVYEVDLDFDLFSFKLMEAIRLQKEGKNSEAEAVIDEYYTTLTDAYKNTTGLRNILQAESVTWEELTDLPVYDHNRRLLFRYLALKHENLFENVRNYLQGYHTVSSLGHQLVDQQLELRSLPQKGEQTNPSEENVPANPESTIPAKVERPSAETVPEPAGTE
ncbi:cellulose synthase subunit BcsC [Polystyrenella longa]|uniref:Cellulose synthase subunit BcsC n=1 Tax=Polystyrenella longa TaxID=2528007 RepID=A0A518CLT4_9PLAN|nr:tetratricopeptide repeat protein [Polystyrenella longa]QDU80178.1 cellulose synthase subunit BcsC [Polystyrenella longa]